ncbi:MAG: hypothetical protein LBQ22_02825 [Bacteroidales bacterium]|jgi:hypothetical protein|nr:hypothetical protein [Bacteroidales bacterium]
MKNFFILLFSGVLLFTINSHAQKTFENGGIYSTDPINPQSYNNNLFQEILFFKINNYMDSLELDGYETDKLFVEAAKSHAELMAETQEASLEGKGKQKTVRDRLIAAGGSGIGSELVARINIRLSNEYITYDNLAEQVLSRWVTGKFSKDLFAQKFFLGGAYGQIDDSGKKIFVSMYTGNYTSFKSPADAFLKLDIVPNNIKGLNPYDEKICKKAITKGPVITDLQEGLYVNENGEIFFRYNDLKKFKKLIRENEDGLAVDIIQKAQFDDCLEKDYNIVDYSKINIGYATKPVYSKNIYANNLSEGEGKQKRVTRLEVKLGEVPATLQNANDYELNLMIIKSKHVCANVSKSYVDNKIYDFVPKITLLPDTVEIEGVNKYVPMATSSELKFRINFEQGKYDYNPEDMIPVIEALNEPDFIINKIFIEAYSSLEGTQQENQNLQKKRVQSIIKAFEINQNASIVDSVVTSTNFKDLKTDVKGTPFEEIAEMDMNSAISYVNSRAKEMEYILKNHRYADVTMWVTYNSEGDKEQNYVVDQFNKAVAAKQLDKALSIQKYIMKRVVEGIYGEETVTEMRIPQDKDYVGLNMNKIWLTQFVYIDPINEEYMTKIDELNKLDNTNIYVEYNDILCKIELSNLESSAIQNQLQNRIDRLYNTPLNVNSVDILNIELQYQIMNMYKDSLGYADPAVTRSLAKIKEIIYFDEVKWDNSLKLANIFINHNDYEFAVQLLEPWIYDENVPFVLLTTYVTVCSKINYKVHSGKFYYAMEKIKEHDKSYFCSLFKNNKLSVQTFVNLKVKQLYCNNCLK